MSQIRTEGIRIGALGAGGFGLFALQQFVQIPGVELVGIAATHREAAFAVEQRFRIPDLQDADALLAREDINLIYIATPPFLHHPLAVRGLQAGKHVICEKPLAIELRHADEMIDLAYEKHLLVVANLMQRYNPLYEQVQRLIQSKALGDFVHGYFENYANDETLGPDHWFWDRAKSGGIFIEHGVHFFDMFAGWLGPGKVVAAQRTQRPGNGFEEQVQCTVRYGDGGLVNLYHGFTQPARMDRQEFRLLFERGDISLEEWVPVRAKIRAVVDEKSAREIMEIFPGSRLEVINAFGGKGRSAMGRHKPLDVYQQVDITYDPNVGKLRSYCTCVREMLRDQVHWIYNRDHARKLTERNGRESLAMAIEATRLADQSQ